MDNDTYLRVSIFIGVLVLMAALEWFYPRRILTESKAKRWTTNIGIVIIDSVALRLLGPVSAVAAAEYAIDHNWGILSFLPIPYYLNVLLGIIFLDLAIYWQHALSHKIPLLWRLHRVHHTDLELDVTSAIRFHPIEIIFSVFYKCLVIFILGPIVLSVIVFEIILNASAKFNHANLNIPSGLDKWLRKLIVTPDMHRVHHSTIPYETDSNYGFCLSIWDRLFRSYRPQPELGHQKMQIGLKEYQSKLSTQLGWCLMLPFSKPTQKP